MNTLFGACYIMKNLAFIIIFATLSAACFADESVVFSQVESFRVSDEQSEYGVTEFTGETSASGEVVFYFRETFDGGVLEPVTAEFIPDRNEISRFPQVVEGFYATPLVSIEIANVDESFGLIFGKELSNTLVNGNERVVSVRGIVKVSNYKTSIECDSRYYIATIDSFSTENTELTVTYPTVSSDGC